MTKPDCQHTIAKCDICGSQTDRNCLTKAVLSAKFNDWQHIRGNSGYICVDCAACLAGNSFNGKAFRSYSTLTTEASIKILNKSDIHSIIATPPDPPFVLIVTYTHKKHIFFHAQITTDNNSIYVATDKTDLRIQPHEYNELYSHCAVLYEAGFSKAEIETGKYRKWRRIEDFGTNRFLALNQQIAVHRNTALLEFVVHTLQKENTDDD